MTGGPDRRMPVACPSAIRRAWRVACAGLLLAVAAGCASLPAGPEDARRAKVDPLEPMNRSIYAFNDAVDRAVIRPLARVYADWVHPGVRQMVGNFFGNLGDLWTSVNQLLQGKPGLAAADLGRFAINSIAGFGGLADVASEMGIEKHKEDFGQTLGRWGVPAGPYLMLPFLGPSSLRDAPASGADLSADPLWRVARNGDYYGLWATRIVDGRAGLFGAERVLEGAALDRYSFIRDGYLARRRSLVWDGNPPDDEDDDPLPPSDPRQGVKGAIDSPGRAPVPIPGTGGFRIR